MSRRPVTRLRPTRPRVASAQASIQEAKRRVELEKQQRRDAIEAKGKDEAAREAWLSKREDAVTSPRTKARRKLLRLLYKATRRQNQGYVICEWGCGQWCVIGREKTFHEKESCAKRIMPCLLGCGCRMREEQWLEIPDEEMAFDEPRNRHDRGVPSCGGAFTPGMMDVGGLFSDFE